MKKPTEYTLKTANTTLHYWAYHEQSLPIIIVVHGFRGTHHGLEYIVKLLPDYHVIIPDLPGFGTSSAYSDTQHTIESYADTMLTLIDHLKLKQPPILLGHSMGTVVCAEMLKQRPDVASKLVLINPVSEKPPIAQLFPGYLYHRVAGKYLPEKIGHAVLRNKLLFLLGSSVMTKTRDPELRKLIHWNHITYMKQFAHRRSLLEAFESANSTALDHYIEHITLPTLLIVGKQDTIAPVAGQRRVAKKLTDATLLEFDQVGHIIHYEKPTEAAAAVRAFLNQ